MLNPSVIVKRHFKNEQGKPFICTKYQANFLSRVLTKSSTRYIFLAATQIGKSEIISIAISLFAIIYPNERIGVISYTFGQSQIIFTKAKNHLVDDSPLISVLVDRTKEFTKQTIYMINGTIIQCRSSGYLTAKGETILGFNATILIIDESGSIDDVTYNTKIMRMVSASRTVRMVIECGTPHHKNHFYLSWIDETYIKFHISWQEAVDEGQLDYKEVMKQKERLTPIEFKMWYMAEFPEEAVDSLIKEAWLNNALNLEFKNFQDAEITIGADIARYGHDLSVFTVWARKQEFIKLIDIETYEKQATTKTSEDLQKLHDKYKPTKILIDDTGIGCITQNTQILTLNGWKYPNEIKVGDKVYSKNKNNIVTIETITENILREKTRILKNKNIEFSWSHLLPYKTRNEHKYKLNNWEHILTNKYSILDTEFNWTGKNEDFIILANIGTMPYGGLKIYKKERTIKSEDFARFLGWFLSEGSLWKNSINISQSFKSIHNENILKILKKINIKIKTFKSKSGEINYSFYDKNLNKWIRENCYIEMPHHAQNKKIPDFIKQSDKEVIEAFLEEFNKGDGTIHHGTREYFTNSEIMSDDILELIYKIGKLGNKYIKQKKGTSGFIENREIIRQHNCWCICEYKEKNICFTPEKSEEYFDNVYQIRITGDTKLFYTRFKDNYKAFWTHNGGVTDLLIKLLGSHQSYKVVPINFGSSSSDTERFENIKAEMCIYFSKKLEAGKISFPKRLEPSESGNINNVLNYVQRLIDQLRDMRFEQTGRNRTKIIDPGDKDSKGLAMGRAKSPDFAHSAILGVFGTTETTACFDAA